VGRIPKAVSITTVIAAGGAFGTPVKLESSAEKAAKEAIKGDPSSCDTLDIRIAAFFEALAGARVSESTAAQTRLDTCEETG
jgi:hypothetical protein